MSHVPLPVRVAMGLVITAVEHARKLPDQLTDFPVTAASRAVQVGMRVQQRVTELAIKGDQVFALLRPVEDTPPWATFDEDGEPPSTGTAPTATMPGSSKAGVGVPVVPDPGTEIDEADVARGLTPQNTSGDGAIPGDPRVAPALLAEYDEMSLAELRTRLRGFSLPLLEKLLEHERTKRDRPAFITLLSNRISSVRAQ